MGKGPQSSGNREAKVAKAGKRSGHTVYPAPISPERRAAKEQGEQQFVAKEQLTVTREIEVLVWDKALGGAVFRTKKITKEADYVFDASRGRVVYSPSFKEKASK